MRVCVRVRVCVCACVCVGRRERCNPKLKVYIHSEATYGNRAVPFPLLPDRCRHRHTEGGRGREIRQHWKGSLAQNVCTAHFKYASHPESLCVCVCVCVLVAGRTFNRKGEKGRGRGQGYNRKLTIAYRSLALTVRIERREPGKLLRCIRNEQQCRATDVELELHRVEQLFDKNMFRSAYLGFERYSPKFAILKCYFLWWVHLAGRQWQVDRDWRHGYPVFKMADGVEDLLPNRGKRPCRTCTDFTTWRKQQKENKVSFLRFWF